MEVFSLCEVRAGVFSLRWQGGPAGPSPWRRWWYRAGAWTDGGCVWQAAAEGEGDVVVGGRAWWEASGLPGTQVAAWEGGAWVAVRVGWRVVGFAGRRRVGKDTAAAALVARRGFVRFAFADALKEALRVLFLLSEEQLHGAAKEEVDARWGRSPRELLQWFGTDVLRAQFDSEFLVRRARLGIEALLAQPGVRGVVITDVRFDNEAALVRQLGGLVVRVVDGAGRLGLADVDAHASEAGVSDALVDRELVNRGTVAELERAAEAMVLYTRQ